MLVLFLTLITIGIALWILTPLFSLSPPPTVSDASSGSMADLYLAKERAYDSIRDLEFDFHSGKLSEKDYRELKEGLKKEALEAIWRLENRGRKGAGRMPVEPEGG